MKGLTGGECNTMGPQNCELYMGPYAIGSVARRSYNSFCDLSRIWPDKNEENIAMSDVNSPLDAWYGSGNAMEMQCIMNNNGDLPTYDWGTVLSKMSDAVTAHSLSEGAYPPSVIHLEAADHT